MFNEWMTVELLTITALLVGNFVTIFTDRAKRSRYGR